jgi:chromosomal replication initiator protein
VGNIREIEGIINSITCQTQLKNRELSLVEVKNLVKNNIRPKKLVSAKEIIKTVAEFYNIEEHLIYDKTRKKEIIKPRQIIMYLLREDFNISYPAIGEKLGGRDHTTVMHSCEKVKNDMKLDDMLIQEINQLRSIFV